MSSWEHVISLISFFPAIPLLVRPVKRSINHSWTHSLFICIHRNCSYTHSLPPCYSTPHQAFTCESKTLSAPHSVWQIVDSCWQIKCKHPSGHYVFRFNNSHIILRTFLKNDRRGGCIWFWHRVSLSREAITIRDLIPLRIICSLADHQLALLHA